MLAQVTSLAYLRSDRPQTWGTRTFSRVSWVVRKTSSTKRQPTIPPCHMPWSGSCTRRRRIHRRSVLGPTSSYKTAPRFSSLSKQVSLSKKRPLWHKAIHLTAMTTKLMTMEPENSDSRSCRSRNYKTVSRSRQNGRIGSYSRRLLILRRRRIRGLKR